MKKWKMNRPGYMIRYLLEGLKGVVDTKPDKVRNAMPYAIFVFSMALGLFLFFDRYPMFHDEIINTFKANTGHIFEYALRPVYYFMNFIFYNLFGSSPLSLTLAAVIYYALTASLLYAIGQRYFGFLGGFLCSFIFMFMPLVIHTGIRGMPHLPAGLMSVVIMYFLSGLFAGRFNKRVSWYMALIGVLAIIMLATHPTTMGVSAALILWAVVGLMFKGRYFSIFFPTDMKRKHFVLLLTTIFVSFVLLNILYLHFNGRSYLFFLFSFFERSDKLIYESYFQPWNWYFLALLNHGKITNIFVLFLSLYFFINLIVCKRKLDLSSPSLKFVTTVLLSSMIFIITLSLSKWKFERVFVSFIPFYALSAGLTIGYVVSWFIKNKNSIVYSLLAFLLILAGGVWGMNSFSNYSIDTKKNIPNSMERYYGLYSQLLNANTTNIGVVGEITVQRFAMRYITIAGKSQVKIGDSLGELGSDEGLKELINNLVVENVEYFLIPTGRKTLGKNISDDYKTAFTQLVSAGATKQYSWRGLYELWRFDIIQQSSHFYKYLMEVNPRSRIGVYGTKEEVGETYFGRFQFVANKFNLRIYPLVSGRRSALQNMGFINRNDVSMILFPHKEIAGIKKDKLDEMKQFLEENAWECIAKADKQELELWVRMKNE